MRFDVELIESRRGVRRASAALAMGLVCFAVGLAFLSVMNRDHVAAKESTVQAQLALEDLRQHRRTSDTAMADSEVSKRLRQYQYVHAFPWSDVFTALEAVTGAQLVSITSAAEHGVIRAEFTARKPETAAAAATQLGTALPEWRVTITRQSQQPGRSVLTIELADPRGRQ